MKEGHDGGPVGYDPDFLFGGNRVISEANWVEYEEQGVSNVVEAIPEGDDNVLRDEFARRSHDYGAANILLGDAFDREAGRPLQHKPGIGLYATAAGREQYQRVHPPPVLKLGGESHVLRKGESIRLDRNDMRTDADDHS